MQADELKEVLHGPIAFIPTYFFPARCGGGNGGRSTTARWRSCATCSSAGFSALTALVSHRLSSGTIVALTQRMSMAVCAAS